MKVVPADGPAPTITRPPRDDRRVPGLDGIRGLMALYVVAHHCWLLSFPGYPADTGPGWLGWLVHGRLAVVVFITLSGFSLAIAPARNGWRLGGTLRFARRRARRILPAYWAALAASAAIAAAVPHLPLSRPPTLRSMVVYGLLLQDFTAAPAPNGAFWSIAVEAALYLAFPLVLLARRRAGATATLAAVTMPVVAAGVLHPAARTTAYTLQLAPLFTLGALAAGIVTAGDRIRNLPWLALAAAAGTPVLTLIAIRGPVWTVAHYYWMDLAAGPAIALFLAAVATRRPPSLIRLLNCGPLRTLGGFSYSLYLIHMPMVALISTHIARPHAESHLSIFAITAALAIPLCLTTARLFAAFFETAFGCTGIDRPRATRRRPSWSGRCRPRRAEIGGQAQPGKNQSLSTSRNRFNTAGVSSSTTNSGSPSHPR